MSCEKATTGMHTMFFQSQTGIETALTSASVVHMTGMMMCFGARISFAKKCQLSLVSQLHVQV